MLRPSVLANTLIRTPLQIEKSQRYNFLNKRYSRKQQKKKTHDLLKAKRIPSLFMSPELSEAKKLLDSFISIIQTPPDRPFHNSLLQSYALMYTVDNSISSPPHDPNQPRFLPRPFNSPYFFFRRSAKHLILTSLQFKKRLNLMFYASLVNGLRRKGDSLGALALLKEMETRDCSPNSCIYNTFLHGLCKSKLLEKGIEFYGMMKEGGMKLEVTSYATFVRALCRVGQVSEAYDVFYDAVESKSLTDVAAYTTLESTFKWLKKAEEKVHAAYLVGFDD